jgi:hypothetical protein
MSLKMLLRILDRFLDDRINTQTQHHLADLTGAQVFTSRRRASALLRELAAEPGPHVILGETEWGQPVRVPLELLVKAFAVLTGGTGAGKTMAAIIIIEAMINTLVSAIINRQPLPLSFGILDPKGELFLRTLYLLSEAIRQLPPAEAEALRRKINIIDLSLPDPLKSYNIASQWLDSDLDFFANSRAGMLQELLGDSLSLRGLAIIKNTVKLLAECRLPFSYFDHVLASEALRARLLARSQSEDLKHYFRHHFPSESRATIAAVRARIASSLLGSTSTRLALSGLESPDFRKLQDESMIVLIYCGGQNISEITRRTFQALALSDIRQAVFARTTKTPYLWICDEAQNFFRTRQLRENMTELLTMARSFGSFFLYLTQNLSTAVQDGEMLETLHTNIRWSLSLRGTARDCAFLQPALPLTGHLPKPRVNPYTPQEFYSPQEERALLLNGLAYLPDRTGWLWLKSRAGEAIKIKTRALEIPEGERFTECVNRLRLDPNTGYRTSRAAYLAEIERRDREWLGESESGQVEKLKKSYREDQEVGG